MLFLLFFFFAMTLRNFVSASGGTISSRHGGDGREGLFSFLLRLLYFSAENSHPHAHTTHKQTKTTSFRGSGLSGLRSEVGEGGQRREGSGCSDSVDNDQVCSSTRHTTQHQQGSDTTCWTAMQNEHFISNMRNKCKRIQHFTDVSAQRSQ